MTRRWRTFSCPGALLALAGLTAGIAGCRPAEPPPPTNLILISLDTLRADRLGSYGYERETTPHIDAFADRSIVFLNAQTQFTTTHYSHKVLFTGRYAFRRGIPPTLAQLLKRAGFRTAGFTGGGYLSRDFGFAEGFDEYHDDAGRGSFETTIPLAIEWLRANRDRPFFLLLHTYDIHCPYTPPEPYASMFRREGESRLEFEGHCGSNYFDELDLTAEDQEDIAAAYDGGVRWVDDMMGPLFEEFERLGLYDDTMIVLTSDHGEALGVGNYVGHGNLNEEEILVPLIIYLPGVGGLRLSAPVGLVDVAPTVLAQLGVPPTLRLDGVDLTPVIRRDEDFEEGRARLTQSIYGEVAFRTDDRWKLVTRGEQKGSKLLDLDFKPPKHSWFAEIERGKKLLEELLAVVELEPGGRPFIERAESPEDLTPGVRKQLEALGYAE